MRFVSLVMLVCFAILTAVGMRGSSPTVKEGASTVKRAQGQARKFDEFTGPNWESAMAHLDNFAVNLQNEPAAVGVVFVYGGQRRRRGEANAWSSCLKDYLLKRRSVDAARVIFVAGGYRENLAAELWIAPSKEQVPAPSATVKPAQVKFAGRRVTRWRSLCSL
jgi:hypothetical protein